MKNLQILIFSVLQIIILYVVIKESKSIYKSYVNKELKLNHFLFFIIISISLSFYFVRNIIRLANLE